MRISGSPVWSEPLAVELADGVVEIALGGGRDAGGAFQVQDRIALAAEGHALERRGQKAAGPERGAGAGAAGAGLQDDEAGEIVRFAAEAVGDPGPHRRAAGGGEARVHEELGRAVVEDVGREALQPADFIDDLFVVRQHFAEREAALADALELALAAHQRFVALEEGETLAFEQALRRRLAVQLAELGLVVEQLQLARGAGHEEVDDVLDLGGEMAGRGARGLAGSSLTFGAARGGDAVAGEELVEGDGADADAALAEEVAASGGF